MGHGSGLRWFGHAGDIGDVIYALPTIRAAGGGRLVLYDHPGRTAHGMTADKVDRLRPLLERQPYIESVEFSEVIQDHPLNGFRDHGAHGVLTDMHLATHGFDWRHRIAPWIEVDEPLRACPVLIHRSPRYHNPNFPWADVLHQYHGSIGFCGVASEHELFCKDFGWVPLVHLPDFMSLARAIAGCDLFIGNQSSPLAIAHAMKHRVIMEVCPGSAQQHCVFQREGCMIVWDQKVEWPILPGASRSRFRLN